MNDLDPWRNMAAVADVWMSGVDDAASLRARQRKRLGSLLAAARRHTRLHAERLRGISDDAPLSHLPRLDRQTLMDRFDDAVADPTLTLAGVRAFVADPARIGTPCLGRYTVWESSGSGGAPGLYVQDAAAMAVYDALETLRRPRPAWPDPFGVARWSLRQCFVGAVEGHFASEVSLRRLRRLNPWLASILRSFTIMQPLPDLVAQLTDGTLRSWPPTPPPP